MLTPREKSPLPKMSPEEDRTRDAVDSEPKHYQLSYSGPGLVCNPSFPPSSGNSGLGTPVSTLFAWRLVFWGQC